MGGITGRQTCLTRDKWFFSPSLLQINTLLFHICILCWLVKEQKKPHCPKKESAEPRERAYVGKMHHLIAGLVKKHYLSQGFPLLYYAHTHTHSNCLACVQRHLVFQKQHCVKVRRVCGMEIYRCDILRSVRKAGWVGSCYIGTRRELDKRQGVY